MQLIDRSIPHSGGLMSKRIYRSIPPIELNADGSLYRMTPSQRKRGPKLIRHKCCSYDRGNCLELDDGHSYLYPQSAARYSAIWHCRWINHWKPSCSVHSTRSNASSATGPTSPSPTGRNIARTALSKYINSRRVRASEKDACAWTISVVQILIVQRTQNTRSQQEI